MRDLRGWDGHLVELAWELSDLGFDSAVRFPPGRRPSVEIFLPPKPRRAREVQWCRTAAPLPGRRRDRWLQERVRNAVERITKAVTP